MSLLFIDGFDHYVTADLVKKWSSVAGSPTVAAASGRRGGGALSVTAGNYYVTKTFTAGASFVLGFAFNAALLPTANRVMAEFKDAGTTQCDLRLNTDGTLSVTRAGTALTNGTSTNTLSIGTYYYIEWKVTIANSISAGSCKVRVNGVDWITVATSQDTQATANATANSVSIGTTGAIGTTWLYDDFYLCNSAGSTNNDFIGDCRIDTIYPTSDGNYTAWTPSTGTDHYALVDETAPNTTDYNSGAASGDRDSYGYGNLPALTSQTVYGVQVNAALLKDDAGARSAGTMARSGTTDSDGAGVALSTGQLYVSEVYELDPNTSTAWTETTVNAAEFGVKVTA